MTQDEIIRMAREAGAQIQSEWNMGGLADGFYMEYAEEVALCVAALVVAHEREACAKVCETDIEEGEAPWTACDYAAAIRARSN